jgi:hypothetical protein
VAKLVKLSGKLSGTSLIKISRLLPLGLSVSLDYKHFEATGLDPLVTRKTLQQMGLDYVVWITFYQHMTVLLLSKSGIELADFGA